jgi:hypothetical protein
MKSEVDEIVLKPSPHRPTSTPDTEAGFTATVELSLAWPLNYPGVVCMACRLVMPLRVGGHVQLYYSEDQ